MDSLSYKVFEVFYFFSLISYNTYDKEVINMLFDLTKDNFNEFIHDTSGFVLVEFYAPTCKNCQSLMPILEDISDEYYGQLKVFKINTETEGELADQYDVMTLPTTILFNNKEVIKSITGLQSYKKMEAWLDL